MTRKWTALLAALLTGFCSPEPVQAQAITTDLDEIAKTICNPGHDLRSTRLNGEGEGSYSIVGPTGRAVAKFVLGFDDLPGLLGRLPPELAQREASEIRQCLERRIEPLLRAMLSADNQKTVLVVDSILKPYRRGIPGASNADDIITELEGTPDRRQGSRSTTIRWFSLHTGPASQANAIVGRRPDLLVVHFSAFEAASGSNADNAGDRPCALTSGNECADRLFKFLRPVVEASIPVLIYSRADLCVRMNQFSRMLNVPRRIQQGNTEVERGTVRFLRVPQGSNFTGAQVSGDVRTLVLNALNPQDQQLRTTNKSCILP